MPDPRIRSGRPRPVPAGTLLPPSPTHYRVAGPPDRGGGPSRTLADVTPSELLGAWSFERTVCDRRSRADYRARGTAVFSLQSDGRIRWSEEGVLSWDAGSNPFTRTLFLVPAPSGWMVTFEDGRDFHPWTDGDVIHLCGRDTYRGGIGCRGVGWGLTWTVSGPQKDYTMTTLYQPREDSPADRPQTATDW